jgi:hypothetical protein
MTFYLVETLDPFILDDLSEGVIHPVVVPEAVKRFDENPKSDHFCYFNIRPPFENDSFPNPGYADIYLSIHTFCFIFLSCTNIASLTFLVLFLSSLLLKLSPLF